VRRLVKYLLIELHGGLIQDARILDTQAELDAFQDDWAQDRGFADWEEYQTIGHATDGLVWYTFTVTAALLSLDAKVTLS